MRIGINTSIPTSPPDTRTSDAPVRQAVKDAVIELVSNQPHSSDSTRPITAMIMAA
jgi:hypothetical protein